MDERLSMSILQNVPVYLPEKGILLNWLVTENQSFKANQKIAEAICFDQVVEIKTIEKGFVRKILVQVGTFVDAEFVFSSFLLFFNFIIYFSLLMKAILFYYKNKLNYFGTQK